MKTLSTRDLSKLPAPGRLSPWCRSLAVLDLILFPDDWEDRMFSFDPAWGKAQMFQFRDGSGDHMNILFPEVGGAAIRGFAHESKMSPWSGGKKKGKPWPGVFDGLPKAFSDIRTEPAFGGDEITFCAWWSREHEMAWRIGDVAFPAGTDPDGSVGLMEILAGTPATYAKMASAYVERKIPVSAVEKICAGAPLTEALVRSLNPDAMLADIRDEALALGRKVEEVRSPPVKAAKAKPRAKTTTKTPRPAAPLFSMKPIGFVRSTRKEAVDDHWDKEAVRIELDARFGSDALAGLETFSHVEILFVMNGVDEAEITSGARHPRENPAWHAVGIFAQRASRRPNRIGVTVCAVEKVNGRVLFVRGLDATHGTPVLDLKPWVSGFGPRGKVREPAWIKELMKRYWK